MNRQVTSLAILFFFVTSSTAILARQSDDGPRTLLWFDGSDPLGDGTSLSDGDSLQLWSDKSGNEFHAESRGESETPTFQNFGTGTSGGIRFDGGGQILTSTFNPSLSFNSDAGVTSFAVFSSSNFSDTGFVWGADFEARPPQLLVVEGNSNGTASVVSAVGAGEFMHSDTLVTGSQNYLVSVGSNFGDGLFQVNGERQSSSDSIGQSAPVASSFHLGNVRSNNGSVGNFGLNGGIAEIVVFDTSLTETQQSDVNAYLGQKWGVGMSSSGDAIRGKELVAQGAIAAPKAAIRNPMPEAPVAKKLVVVTHGWANETADEVTLAWVNSMRDTIRQDIDNRLPDEKDEWEVIAYDWTESSGKGRHSNTNLLGFKGFNDAFNNAGEHGREQGAVWGKAGYEHVHLIGFSAGAGLLNEAATAIDEAATEDSTAPDVHLTFLDGFIPVGRNTSSFAKDADWADNLYTRDILRTNNAMQNAHNVDLTALVDTPAHFSPVEFYKHSIDGKIFRESVSSEFRDNFEDIETDLFANALVRNTNVKYGFDLTLEANKWFDDLNPELQAKLANNPDDVVYFSGDTGSTDNYIDPVLVNYAIASHRDSVTGEVEVQDGLVSLVTGSPAWTIMELDIESSFDILSFTMDFNHDEDAEGLLAIYLNDTYVGAIDERFDSSGEREYIYSLDNLVFSEQNRLAFRLDAFTNSSSSVSISEIKFFSTVAVPEPTSTPMLVSFVIFYLAGRRQKRKTNNFACHVQPQGNSDW